MPAHVTEETESERRVKVTLYLPRDLLEWMKGHCEANGMAQSRLLTVLVQRYRDQH